MPLVLKALESESLEAEGKERLLKLRDAFNRARLIDAGPVPNDFVLALGANGKVSFEFVDTPLGEAILFYSTLTSVRIRTTAGLGKKSITIKVSGIGKDNALRWILRLSDAMLVRKGDEWVVTKRQAASEK